MGKARAQKKHQPKAKRTPTKQPPPPRPADDELSFDAEDETFFTEHAEYIDFFNRLDVSQLEQKFVSLMKDSLLGEITLHCIYYLLNPPAHKIANGEII